MNSKTLIIYDYQILFEILNEISESLNFKIIQSNKEEYNDLKLNFKNDHLIISRKKIQGLNNVLILEEKPIKLRKLLEIININLLKNKFYKQSNIKIGKYSLDLNSRKIFFKR